MNRISKVIETSTKIAITRSHLHRVLAGGIGAAAGSLVSEPIIDRGTPIAGQRIIDVGVWFGLISALAILALVYAQIRYLRHTVMHPQQLFRYTLLGAGVGLLSGGVAQLAYQYLQETTASDYFVRPLCWALAGLGMGLLASNKVPNLGHVRGALAGSLGGFAGGLAFILICQASSEVFGRSMGVFVIGVCIGVAIVLADLIAREAWLEVLWAPGEVTNVALGGKEVTIGGTGSDTIYSSGQPARALVLTFVQGKVCCAQSNPPAQFQLREGSRISFGTITITVRVRH